MSEKGSRMSQILKMIMVRRTHSSELNGRSIVSNLPSVQRLIYECKFTEDEKLHYEAANADTSSRLFKKTQSATGVEWNTTAYRRPCLLSNWLGFHYLLDYKARKLARMRKTNRMSAIKILKYMRAGQARKGIPEDKQIPIKNHDPEDIQAILSWHCVGSPKLRRLLAILAEIVILRQEKTLLWVNTPAQSEWLQQVSSNDYRSRVEEC
jgi:hypothetical protein